MHATAERLLAVLADLPVVVERADVSVRTVDVPSYGGARPTSIVTLSGGGRVGRGEHVGWTIEEHEAFAGGVRALALRSGTIGELSTYLAATGAGRYDRAALEAAAIALALAQRGTTLGALAGAVPRPVHTVVSFARVADPADEARRHPDHALKVDVDPSWSERTWAALGAVGRTAILDWKDTGDAVAYARALRAIPGALHEDPAPPWPQPIRARLARDAALTSAASIDTIEAVACNLKPARMGGVLEAIRAAAACAARGLAVYVGGMFEIDVGRTQLRDLAALLCPDGPNDLAPIALAEPGATP